MYYAQTYKNVPIFQTHQEVSHFGLSGHFWRFTHIVL